MGKPTLQPSEAASAINRWAGQIGRLEPLSEGLVCQVFGFTCRGERFVARFGRSAEGFEKDRFAGRTFASAALPIPEVVAIETLAPSLYLCISRRAQGAPIGQLHNQALNAAVAAIPSMLQAIADADIDATTGFGDSDASGRARSTDWRLFLAEPTAYDWASLALRVDLGLVASATDLLLAGVPREPVPRALIHGDFGAANLIANRGRITGVIDWDRLKFGDPAYDDANLLFWGEHRLGALIDDLASRRADDADRRRRLACYQLRICLEELRDAAAGHNPVDLAWLLARCRTLVERDAGLVC